MLTKTTFLLDNGKTVDSYDDLNLLEQTSVISPAVPQINLIAVLGANGSTDATEALGTVTFEDRTMEMTYALYPEDIDDYAAKCSEVSNLLNGRHAMICRSDDPDFYYDGRLSVSEFATDKTLKQIVITATAKPYKIKRSNTVVRVNLSTTAKTINLINLRKPVLPKITTTVAATIVFGGNTYTINAGTHRLSGICLADSGVYPITVTAQSGTGTMTVTYREGTL